MALLLICYIILGVFIVVVTKDVWDQTENYKDDQD